MDHYSLNGTDWICKAYLGEDWLWRDAHKFDTNDRNHWYAASVPGSVMHDALQNQLIDDPYVGVNSLKAEWVPVRTWVYKKVFRLPASFNGMQAQLCFKGVDYQARFYLNNELLTEHIGMYTPVCFDVTHLLRPGEDNLLAVVISPAPMEQPQVGYTSKVRTHKSRMTYWWDFCPRMVHQGIWQEVFIHFFQKARIDNLHIKSDLNPELSEATIQCAMHCTATDNISVVTKLIVTQGEKTVFETVEKRQLYQGGNEIQWQFSLNQPLLWQPNGSGGQPLYQAKVEIFSEENQPCDSIEETFGIREIHFIPNENADPQALPLTLIVNGRKTYIKGWNWVPIDVMYGVPQLEKLTHLLRLAREANVNLLRVWGGGLIETEAFYNLCDCLGIMVWQEFIQSSSGIENIPPDNPEFIRFMEGEARQIIPMKRNHPSLVTWCGGNELSGSDSSPSNERAPLLATLKKCVQELDPGRAWFPTSPSGKHGTFDLRLEPGIDPRNNHDVHGPWEYQGLEGHYALYNGGGDSLLHSEFGVEGITNLRTLETTFPKEHLLPISLTNPYWEHRGAWWLKENNWQTLFGKWNSVEMAVQATQYMQAEGLRYAVEADRRRQYHNSGTMPWQFNEPFPMAASTSAVDYFGYPKPAYYSVRQAYESLHLSARYPQLVFPEGKPFETQIFCSNSGERWSGDLTVCLRDLLGNRFSSSNIQCELPENSTVHLLDFTTDLHSVGQGPFFLDMNLYSHQGVLISSNRILFSTGSNLSTLFAQPQVSLIIERKQNLVKITNQDPLAALGIWLESACDLRDLSWVYFDQNYFHLLPHESKTIRIESSNSERGSSPIFVRGWNTPAYVIHDQGQE